MRSPTSGWWERLSAAAVLAHVVGGPPGAEVLALHGELADEVGEVGIVGVAARLGAEVADARIGDPPPSPSRTFGTAGRGRRSEPGSPAGRGWRRLRSTGHSRAGRCG